MTAKNKIVLILALLIAISIAIVAIIMQRLVKENQEAQLLMGNTERLEIIQSAIATEYDRCTGFLLQEEGEFAQFEYCKQYVSWVDKTF